MNMENGCKLEIIVFFIFKFFKFKIFQYKNNFLIGQKNFKNVYIFNICFSLSTTINKDFLFSLSFLSCKLLKKFELGKKGVKFIINSHRCSIMASINNKK